MTRIDRIGIDLGTASMAGPHAAAAAAAGAGMARVRFALEGRPMPDAGFLEAARSTVSALRAAGLGILAVLDSDLTVAPEGMGAFEDRPPGPLAQAWTDEMATNVAELVASLGDAVTAWEILPAPNRGAPPRIAPARWAALVADFAAAARGVLPGARIIAGGLVTDDDDDGVDYLVAAYRAALGAGIWSAEAPPFDAIGLQLFLLPDGGATEDDVAATLRERVRRLWRVMERFEGSDRARERGLYVTGLAWDADRVGADVQARDVWTALDVLTSEPIVKHVIWTGLTDANPHAGGATGLYRGASIVPNDRRWAWNAFNDFALYARQISPAPSAVDLLESPEAGAEPAADAELAADAEPHLVDSESAAGEGDALDATMVLVVPDSPEAASAAEPAPLKAEEGMAWPAAAAAAGTLVAVLHAADQEAQPTPEIAKGDTLPLILAPVGEAASQVDQAPPVGAMPEDAAAPEVDEALPVGEVAPGDEVSPIDEALPVGEIALDEAPQIGLVPAVDGASQVDGDETIEFRIPDVAEVLRGQGLDGPRLAAALEAIRLKYGGHEWLRPGAYRVAIPAAAAAPIEQPGLTNQQVISALYRAGGGTWRLFDRAGLSLGDLAARRSQAYAGPPITALEALSEDERQAIGRELGQVS